MCFKVCRNCGTYYGTKKRKCPKCRGKLFDRATEEQIAAEEARKKKAVAFLEKLAREGGE